jgi:hypothetical protein
MSTMLCIGCTAPAHGPQNSKMISVVEWVTKGSDFMKAKGYAPSNLGRAPEIGRLRIDRGAAAALPSELWSMVLEEDWPYGIVMTRGSWLCSPYSAEITG